MYTSTSKSVYLRLTLLLLQHLVHSFTVCLAAQKCGICLLTLYIRLSNPTKCNLHNINLLVPILKAMTLIQVPVTSRIDYCFISYFVHIQSVFYTNTVMRLFHHFYLKTFNYTSTEQIPYYDITGSSCSGSFLPLKSHFSPSSSLFPIQKPYLIAFNFLECSMNIYSFPYGIISLLGMLIDLENTTSFYLFIFISFFYVFLDLA